MLALKPGAHRSRFRGKCPSLCGLRRPNHWVLHATVISRKNERKTGEPQNRCGGWFCRKTLMQKCGVLPAHKLLRCISPPTVGIDPLARNADAYLGAVAFSIARTSAEIFAFGALFHLTSTR